MKLADFNRLVKFMEMTTSSADNEALTAIRKANELLKENNADWKKVFARMVTLEVEAVTNEGRSPHLNSNVSQAAHIEERAEQMRHMFQTLLDNTSAGDFRKFILSLEAQYQQKGSLTPAQHEALKRSYDRVRVAR